MPSRLRPPARSESEAEFQAAVISLAVTWHWLAYHTFDSRRSESGFPDLTLVRAPELLIVELKSEKGRVRPDQQGWLDQLAGCGVEVHVWRPSDWPFIEDRLKRKWWE